MDINDIDPREWAAAQRRAEVLSKLPEWPSGEQIRDAMAALGIGRTTLFRWLKRFRESARTSALAPRRRGPHSGMRPLAPDVLTIVETHFREFYATRRRPTLTRFWAEVAADCQRQGCPVPSIRRLRRWIARQDEAELLRRREGRGKSEPVFLATPGKPVRPGLAALACELAAAELRFGGQRGAPDRKPRRARRGGAGGSRRRGGNEPTPDFGVVALGDASAHRRPTATPHGPDVGRQKCFWTGSNAAQFHKLCASPTNFGWFRPINCESESRNYARLRGVGRRIPKISAFRQHLRRVLGSWPWVTRRRIDAQLRRYMDSSSLAKNASDRGRLRRSSINYARGPQISDRFVP